MIDVDNASQQGFLTFLMKCRLPLYTLNIPNLNREVFVKSFRSMYNGSVPQIENFNLKVNKTTNFSVFLNYIRNVQ